MPDAPQVPLAPRPQSKFITSLAWTGLIGGVFCLVSGLFQWTMTEPFAEQGFIDIVAQLKKYAMLSIVGSIPMIWVSWGLLIRKEWGRKGMIALIVFAVIAHFAMIPMLQASFALAGDLPADSIPGMIIGMLKWMTYGGLALATLVMIWLGRKLTTQEIKNEFS
ncbi:MAG: hypothetical protein COB53_09965 [Elusimicrobia bacterium]|nr:MAG: hypothetical protein COB53_09965 [Elusimicrobiota bacterium]